MFKTTKPYFAVSVILPPSLQWDERAKRRAEVKERLAACGLKQHYRYARKAEAEARRDKMAEALGDLAIVHCGEAFGLYL